jgi:hypothetical protein
MKKLIGLMFVIGCFAQNTSKLDEHIAKAHLAFVNAYDENNKMFNIKAADLGEEMNKWVATRNATVKAGGKISKLEKDQWERVVGRMESLDETAREWVVVKEKFDMLKEAMKSEQ